MVPSELPPEIIVSCPNQECCQKLRVPNRPGILSLRCPICRTSFQYGREEEREEAENDHEFFERLKLGPCAIQIPISEIPDYYDGILQHLSSSEVGRMSTELHGVCPTCCFWMDCATLAQPLMIRESKTTVVFGGGVIKRLLSGRCPNSSCQSKDILLTWKRPTELGQSIDSHLRHLEDSVGSGCMPFVEQLRQAEATAYVADVIYVLRKKSPFSGHRYCAQKTRNGDLGICVSVIPGNRGSEHVRKQAFPHGYPSFFFEMVRHFGWESGDIAVAHWTFWYDDAGIQILYLGFVSAHNNADRPGAKILPIELLTKTEREELNL